SRISMLLEALQIRPVCSADTRCAARYLANDLHSDNGGTQSITARYNIRLAYGWPAAWLPFSSPSRASSFRTFHFSCSSRPSSSISAGDTYAPALLLSAADATEAFVNTKWRCCLDRGPRRVPLATGNESIISRTLAVAKFCRSHLVR